jgi:hypothetical protein
VNSLLHHVGDAVGDNSCLAAAWAGENQKRAFHVFDGLPLGIGQAAEQRLVGTR